MSQPVLRIVAPPEKLSLPSPYARSIALIGNYPPRRCGIATFTADVYQAVKQARPDIHCEVYALTDVDGAYRYPSEVACEIGQDSVADYLAAADRLSDTMPDLVCVQHEFGIFGGLAGEHLMMLLGATDRPVVTTLHTILETPDEDQRRVFEKLLARSARVVVMAERGHDILRRVWSVPAEKIVFVPHGAPDRAYGATAPFKEALGYGGRELLFTFGLLSPGKGIETVIRALPRIAAECPNVTYAVLGATHPHLVALEGESYRHSLVRLAQDLGVENHVCLTDAYTDTPRLVEHLQAADVYVTPYLNAQQITSGTLAYAAALGRPIVSTPYWHAEELLADGRGRLVPFGSSDAIADEVIDLLTHPDARETLGRRIWQASRDTVWPRFGVRMIEAFDGVLAQSMDTEMTVKPLPAEAIVIAPSLGGIRRMTDSCGMMQHSLYSVPDRRHGYCVDDNARALILMHQLPGPVDAERASLTSTYAAFLADAWNDDEKRFRNFLGFDRRWLESRGSDDSHGRSVWAVAMTAARAADRGQRHWAISLMKRILEADDGVSWPRSDAFIILGLSIMVEAGYREGTGRLRSKAEGLSRLLRRNADQGCPWFEPFLAYDNARLPEALIRAGVALDVPAMVSDGVAALNWLCRRQTGARGYFQPVATIDFGRPLDARNVFDQQPVDAAATVDACEAAWMATGDGKWVEEAKRAYAWFLGSNTMATPLTTGDGDCFDGLTWSGVNENQGAESVLSLQLATCTLRTLTEHARSRLKLSATPTSP